MQKRAKMEKRKHIYLDFFAFISLVHFFCILNLKIHIKKGKNAKKKQKKIFKLQKYICKKKAENNITKKDAKKSRNAKKAGGV